MDDNAYIDMAKKMLEESSTYGENAITFAILALVVEIHELRKSLDHEIASLWNEYALRAKG